MSANYGNTLKELIDKSGFRQKEIAEKVGVTPANISQWVTKAYPPLEGIEKVCEVLNISLAEFFVGGKDLKEVYGVNPKLIEMCRKIEQLSQEKQIKFLKHVLSGIDLLEE
jgi:transcriptional regulator with XRE-family HTH domain